ncbi:hypothetical protein Ssi02_33550 [Sinosporangium siamense]|uniref:Uncharacterized protein n=1 Tax=Sinosporangium siamense TaxID=1367973 RepID=A0A919VCH1_9ACTN|nr:hypothetical protein Ssi02_33550 [Sinosporangium siamense]
MAALVCFIALGAVGGLILLQTPAGDSDSLTLRSAGSIVNEPGQAGDLRLQTPTPTPAPTATPAATPSYTATTKIIKKSGSSYLQVKVKTRSSAKFNVRQRVCRGDSCRTQSADLIVASGQTLSTTPKLGKGSYRKSGRHVVTVLPLPTVTATVTATPTVTTTVTATPRVTVTTTPAPTPGPTVTATVTVTATPGATTRPTANPDRCGAPDNNWGLHYCASPGNLVTSAPAGLCDSGIFECIPNFNNGTGHIVVCSDGKLSKSGGIGGSCSSHGGNKADVRDGWVPPSNTEEPIEEEDPLSQWPG